MIIFVRHGKTDSNAKKVYANGIDSPLNEIGLAQAKEAAQELRGCKIDVAFCSPLTRARQTMNEILKYHDGVDAYCDERLIERGDGQLEGQSIDERDDERWNMRNWDNADYGETIKSAYARVKDFLDEVNGQYAGKNILIVSHYGIGRLLTCYFNGFPADGNLKSIRIKNAELLEFDNDFAKQK